MKDDLQPISEKNRIVSLDIVRGFAIFGIFIVNIGAFSAPYFMYGGAEAAWPEPINQATLKLIDIFFQGSFYPLFAILFGFSWQLLYERTVHKGMRAYPFLFRRQVLLILFGMCHAFLVWHGDILFTYGFVGLLLLLFIGVKNRSLLVWSAGLLLGSASLLTIGLYTMRSLLRWVNEEMIEQSIVNYSSGNILRIWLQNSQDWVNNNNGITFLMLITMILPLFLIGVFLARKRWIHQPEKYRWHLNRLFVISFVVFILFKIGSYFLGNPLWFSFLQDQVGGTASALFYFLSIVYFVEIPWGRKLLSPLKYVGRMALSHYLLQSLFCFILFYVFGLYHQLEPWQMIFIVIVFYLVQIILSKWWLDRFRFGPFEWLMRSLNYKKIQVFRRD